MGRKTLAGQLREFLPKVYEEYGSLNARQYAYRAEAAGLVTKRQFDYVNSILVKLREDGILPWSAVLDSSRRFEPWRVKGSEDTDKEISRHVERFKRLPEEFDLPRWQYQPVVPVIFTEKEGLIPYFEMVAGNGAVSIYAQKGQVGKSHFHEVVFPWLVKLAADGRSVRILYLGDVDDEGYQIPLTILETMSRWLTKLAGSSTELWPEFNSRDFWPRWSRDEVKHRGSVLRFERVALKPEHVERWGLSRLGVNPRSRIAHKFVDYKCELEALDPDTLRGMIEDAIEGCWDREAEEDRLERVNRLREELGEKVRRLTKGWQI